MILRAGLGRYRRGFGSVPPAGYTDIQSFLDAWAASVGLAPCRSGTYVGCPDPSGFANQMAQAEAAWFAYHPAPGSPGSVTSPVTGMTTVAPPPPAAPASSSRAQQFAVQAPGLSTPAVISSSSAQQAPASGAGTEQGGIVPAPTTAGASCLKFFGDMESCIGPIGSLTLLVLAGLGALLFFGGKK